MTPFPPAVGAALPYKKTERTVLDADVHVQHSCANIVVYSLNCSALLLMKSVYQLKHTGPGHSGAKAVQLLALFRVGTVNCLFSAGEHILRSELGFLDQTRILRNLNEHKKGI